MSCFSGECGLCSQCNPEEPFAKKLRFLYYLPTKDYEKSEEYFEYMKGYNEFLRKEKIRKTKLEDLIQNIKIKN